MNLRLLQTFVTQSPLSHIGESLSTASYLVQEPVLQPDGSVEEVFVYAGNAWRGQLRDLMASYLLEHLGNPTVALDAFHLLYSGGAIGGPQQVNLDRIRQHRALLPPIALLGGGIGNQILPGKLRVSNLYPVCAEAPPSLVPDPDGLRARVSYRQLTTEKSFSRKDDEKDSRLNGALTAPAPALTQGSLLPEDAPKAKAKRETGEPATQMRFTSELLIAGATLTGHIDLLDVSEVELGCLTAALWTFGRSPHLGGQASRGHGRVSLTTTLVDLDTGETHDPFVTLGQASAPALSARAEQAKAAYDAHLAGLYDAMLAARGGEIRALIGATA